MSFILTDDGHNKTLAVVSDGILAQFIKHYYEGIGTCVKLRVHDSVLCETVDDSETSLTYLFEM